MVKRLFRRSLLAPSVATPATSKKVVNYRREYLLKSRDERLKQEAQYGSSRKESVV